MKRECTFCSVVDAILSNSLVELSGSDSKYLVKMSSSESECEPFYSDDDSFTVSDHQDDFSDSNDENTSPNRPLRRDPER